jgi:hypothetical protein
MDLSQAACVTTNSGKLAECTKINTKSPVVNYSTLVVADLKHATLKCQSERHATYDADSCHHW